MSTKLGEDHYEISPQSTAALVNLGLCLLKVGNYAAAVTRFKSVLEKEPDHEGVHYLLGEAYLGLRDYGEAKEAFVRYLNKEPNGFYVNVAKSFLNQINVTGALPTATQQKVTP